VSDFKILPILLLAIILCNITFNAAITASAASFKESYPVPVVRPANIKLLKLKKQEDFLKWIKDFKYEAKTKHKISNKILEIAFADIDVPLQRVIELDNSQPEKTRSFPEYLQVVLSEERVKKGRILIKQNQALLKKIRKKYGVQPRFIVALWGIETFYGKITGNFSIIHSLATLAYKGRAERREFFRKELVNALKILQQNHISANRFKGSWAGAMGQTQFMPSSFLSFAQDFDKDGRKDIWQTKEDVFASIANYLKTIGWDDSVTWGRKVKLTRKIEKSLIGREVKKKLSEWQTLGVRRINGKVLPKRKIKASLIYPSGKYQVGDAYLVYENYDTIMHWNRSLYFATAVGELSNKLRNTGK